MKEKNSDPVQIYVVDDDPGHARLIEKNLGRSGSATEITVFSDGESVLDKLFGEQITTYPVLLLLDLNMPGISGFQVLKALKENDKTKLIPIVILTTANEQSEIRRCYDLGCNLFMNKPMQYDNFAECLRNLGLVLQIVEPPPVTPDHTKGSLYA